MNTAAGRLLAASLAVLLFGCPQTDVTGVEDLQDEAYATWVEWRHASDATGPTVSTHEIVITGRSGYCSALRRQETARYDFYEAIDGPPFQDYCEALGEQLRKTADAMSSFWQPGMTQVTVEPAGDNATDLPAGEYEIGGEIRLARVSLTTSVRDRYAESLALFDADEDSCFREPDRDEGLPFETVEATSGEFSIGDATGSGRPFDLSVEAGPLGEAESVALTASGDAVHCPIRRISNELDGR